MAATEMREFQITLDPDLAVIVDSAVKQGAFATPDQFVRHAIQEWQAREVLSGYEPAELDRLLTEGRDSGPGLLADDVFAWLDRRYGGDPGT